MNAALLAFNVGTGGSLKKQVSLLLATMAVIVSLPAMAVLSLGGEALSFLAGTPNAQAAELQGFYMGGPVEGNTYEWGNCTYWTFAMRLWAGNPIPTTWGNANTWDDRAVADGYVVNQTPAVGAIFQSDAGEWGHVAYVIAVDPLTGEWTISEMNNPILNVVTHRTFARESAIYYDFIHDKIGAPIWTPLPVTPFHATEV